MEDKEIGCTCKVVFSKLLLIYAIIMGALLGILGIITIAGDTNNVFANPFVRYVNRNIRKIAFTDDKPFTYTALWQWPIDDLYFEWTTKDYKMIIETDAKYIRLPTGVRSNGTRTGKVTFPLDNFTIGDHYFCMSNDWGRTCDPRATYHLVVHLYVSTYFANNHYLGNQNMRWSFFVLACLTILFGVIMILGDLTFLWSLRSSLSSIIVS